MNASAHPLRCRCGALQRTVANLLRWYSRCCRTPVGKSLEEHARVMEAVRSARL